MAVGGAPQVCLKDGPPQGNSGRGVAVPALRGSSLPIATSCWPGPLAASRLPVFSRPPLDKAAGRAQAADQNLVVAQAADGLRRLPAWCAEAAAPSARLSPVTRHPAGACGSSRAQGVCPPLPSAAGPARCPCRGPRGSLAGAAGLARGEGRNRRSRSQRPRGRSSVPKRRVTRCCRCDESPAASDGNLRGGGQRPRRASRLPDGQGRTRCIQICSSSADQAAETAEPGSEGQPAPPPARAPPVGRGSGASSSSCSLHKPPSRDLSSQ